MNLHNNVFIFLFPYVSGWKHIHNLLPATASENLLLASSKLTTFIPDGFDILHVQNISSYTMIPSWNTYIDLDVEILKEERVFPNVDANDRDVRQEWVLVGGRYGLKCLALGVVALHQRQIMLKIGH